MSVFWGPVEAASQIAVPTESDDKYSRGVLGMVTGSARYPGAAVIGVEAALHTGVGMVRHIGARRVSNFVLSQRPEVVTSAGRVQAWLLGSGMDAADRGRATRRRLNHALADSVPVILDGGALDLHDRNIDRCIATPHYRELHRMTGRALAEIADDPRKCAIEAAAELGITVLLKGHTTWVASPSGTTFEVRSAPTWLATAGAGDALGGVLGALVATNSTRIGDDPDALARLGATAAVVHGLAAERASRGGPFTIMRLAAEVSAAVAALVHDAG